MTPTTWPPAARGSVGHSTHEADFGSAVDEADAAGGQGLAEGFGLFAVDGA